MPNLRSRVIRLASTLPKGSGERAALLNILAGNPFRGKAPRLTRELRKIDPDASARLLGESQMDVTLRGKVYSVQHIPGTIGLEDHIGESLVVREGDGPPTRLGGHRSHAFGDIKMTPDEWESAFRTMYAWFQRQG